MTPELKQLPAISSESPSGRFRGLADTIRQSILQARLVWRLFFDGRVSWLLKLIPVAGIAYVIFPFDFIPDFFPAIGQMDDLGIFLGSVWLFVDLIPKVIVEEQWKILVTGGKVAPQREAEEKKAGETVIDISPKDT